MSIITVFACCDRFPYVCNRRSGASTSGYHVFESDFAPPKANAQHTVSLSRSKPGGHHFNLVGKHATVITHQRERFRTSLERIRGYVEEIWRGIRPDEEDDAGRLVDGLRLADLGVPEGRLAGRWRREAATQGITLSQADCLIAAAAVGVGAQLATGNPKHFPIEELEVEHWPAGG